MIYARYFFTKVPPICVQKWAFSSNTTRYFLAHKHNVNSLESESQVFRKGKPAYKIQTHAFLENDSRTSVITSKVQA
jgi:hypothetical protein